MGIRFKRKNAAEIVPNYGEGRRTPPRMRWYFILFIVSLPVIYLLNLLAKTYIFITFPGYISFGKITVRAPTSGFVRTLHVKIGMEVNRGDALINFESPEVMTKIKYLKKDKAYVLQLLENFRAKEITSLEKAKAFFERDVKISEDVYLKFKEYRKKGVVDDLKLEEARRNWLDAKRKLTELDNRIKENEEEDKHRIEINYKRRLRDIDNQLKLNLNILKHLTIKAEFNSYVAEVKTYQNEYVSAGQELLKLLTKKDMHIVGFVDPKFINDIYKGKKVTIILPDKAEIAGEVYNLPSFSERVPAAQANPIATRNNKIMILIRLKNEMPKKYQVYGVPVRINLR